MKRTFSSGQRIKMTQNEHLLGTKFCLLEGGFASNIEMTFCVFCAKHYHYVQSMTMLLKLSSLVVLRVGGSENLFHFSLLKHRSWSLDVL